MQRLLATCADLGTAGAVPDSIELLPPGPEIVGRDGRRWKWSAEDAVEVLANFAANGADLPIDWEHASVHKAPAGDPAPAAGWIDALDVVDGALVGHVTWTARAREQIAAREYRYISPVFDFEPATGRIVRLVGAGLTNFPNLHVQALNSHTLQTQETGMERSAQLLAALSALGVEPEATDDEIASAINAARAARDDATERAENAERAQPSLDRYVPRADYDALAERAANAERSLQERDTAAHAAAVDAEINAALEAGKITPATADYHRASCSDAAGLARFREFAAAAPVVGPDSGLDGRRADETTTALNAEELAVCRATGITPEQFAAARGAGVAA